MKYTISAWVFFLVFVACLDVAFAGEPDPSVPSSYPPYTEQDKIRLSILKDKVKDLKSKISSSDLKLDVKKEPIAKAIIAYNNDVDRDLQIALLSQCLDSEQIPSMAYVILKNLKIDDKTLPFFLRFAKACDQEILRVTAIHRLARVVANSEVSELLTEILKNEFENSAVSQSAAEALLNINDSKADIALVEYLYKKKKFSTFAKNYIQKYFPERYQDILGVAKRLYPEKTLE